MYMTEVEGEGKKKNGNIYNTVEETSVKK